MKRLLLSAMALAIGVTTAGGEGVIDHREELLEADREWARVAGSGDLEDLWRFWADDAVMYLEGTLRLTGKTEIQAFVRENRSKPGFSITWTPEGAVTSAAGDLGYTFGVGTITMGEPGGDPQIITKSYVSIWRRTDDGRWECIVET
ncbi:MAG: hypothetical protein DHS20C21_00200 [Gemmatimonadota bacterium]|nr:MAG: hypothetical protein DHS20C21_00200 [Gemmatimonadota bacterium]